VFANLIHNALKFTPERGQVTVSTTLQNGDIAVTVSDTGPGIAPHEISALFERFRRAATNRHREGIGLGLFIVKALVEAHNGRVEIDSTLGQGSRFTVRLPLEDSQLGEVETREV
jgi:signal transduction histidine kinase